MMGLCSNDDLGAAMTLHYAGEAGRKAKEEARELRQEIERLKDRVLYLEMILK